jgi:hypothetical protein
MLISEPRKKLGLTSAFNASGTKTDIPKFTSQAKAKKPVTIFEFEYMAFTRTRNNKEVDACDSIRKLPDIYRTA